MTQALVLTKSLMMESTVDIFPSMKAQMIQDSL